MTACKVCKNPVRKAGIDAALASGLSAAQIARDQELTGWKIGGDTIARHREHYAPPPAVVHPGVKGRDLLAVVRDITIEAVESGKLTITDENWKNVNPGISAQKGLNLIASKTDDRKLSLALTLIMAGGVGGFRAPAALIEDGMTVDVAYEEVEDDDEG